MHHTSRWVAVLVLLVVAFGVWWFAQQGDAAAPDPEPSGSPRKIAAPQSSTSEAVTRELVAAPSEVASETDPAASSPEKETEPTDTEVEPWQLRLEVVDGDRRPVPEAAVWVWAARPIALPIDPTSVYSGRHGEPLFELPTDGFGTLQMPVQVECVVVAASKQGVGDSGEITVFRKRAVDSPVRLVLERVLSLRGLVLRADGLPAAGAKVEVNWSGVMAGLGRGAFPQLEPVIADAEGRFVFSPVARGFGYAIRASLGDERSFAETVWVHESEPPEVVVRFPGAITLRGHVVDEQGTPVAGATVRSWREFELSPTNTDDDETAHVTADEEGRFEISVRRHARYQLVASSDGYAQNAPVWFEPNQVHAHPDAALVLRRPATIAGRVVREDGSPFAGVKVHARAEQGERIMYSSIPNQRDLFGRPDASKTDEDGAFALTVHPDTTWTLSVRPTPGNWRLSINFPGMRPGTTDVLLRVGDAQLAGCVVRGLVTCAEGDPPAHYEVQVVDYHGGEAMTTSEQKGVFDGPLFTLAPLSLGKQVALLLTPKDSDARPARSATLAPTVYGPFTTSVAELDIEFVLQPWGELPVRVVRADGSPAVGVRVGAAPTTRLHSNYQRMSMPVDDQGVIELKMLVPGEAHLGVFDADGPIFDEPVRIEPGRNRERLVQLPK